MKRVNISMAEFLLEELDYMAEKRGMNRSQLIAMLVSDEFMKFQRNGNVEEDYYKNQALMASESVGYY